MRCRRGRGTALRPSSLDHLGLGMTLELLARELGARLGVVVRPQLELVRLGPDAALVAYSVVQEAATNITKHAQAQHVWITLVPQGDQVVLTVRDDGVGFDARAPTRSRYEMVDMRFRADAERGSLTVHSTPGTAHAS